MALSSRRIQTDLDRVHERLQRDYRNEGLLRYCRDVARMKRRMFRDETYWGKPVPGFGDPLARLLLVGLAPAAHGANRTGRMFTGDRSGDFLYAALHRAGFANRPASRGAADGLALKDAYISAIVRCAPPANKPTPEEIRNDLPFLDAELAALKNVRAVLALGRIAWDGVLLLLKSRGVDPAAARGRFAHGAEIDIPGAGFRLFGSYHPSQQNTQTGLLTPAMFDAVLRRVRTYLA